MRGKPDDASGTGHPPAVRRLPAGWLVLGLAAVLLSPALWVGPAGARGSSRPNVRHERHWLVRDRGRPTVVIRWTSYGEDAVEPGLFGPSHLPHLFRSDYVTNSNDSYWLSNPHQPLTGYARVIGDEGTPRSLRTRIGLIMTQARVSGTDGLGPAGFTVKDMENMVFSNRQYAGELWRDPLVALCRSLPGGLAPTSSGIPVAVGDACNVLANWDLHENLDSHGAVLFRRFVDHVMGDQADADRPSVPRERPVHTPSGLKTRIGGVDRARPPIKDLKGAHIPLDATPGDVQAVVHDGVRIPIHGGPGDPNGEFNAIGTTFTPGRGFGPILRGSSFVQVVSWNNGHCPTGGSILTYSQSDNPASPHFDDQTKLFSQKRWIPDRFCMASVLRDTQRTMVLERAPSRETQGAAFTAL